MLALFAFGSSAVGCRPAPEPHVPSPPPAPAAVDETPSEEDEATAEAADAVDEEPVDQGPCGANMALIATGDKRFCIDKFEASLIEIQADGSEKAFPHYLPVDGHDVRAVSEPSVFPQGFISEVQAQDACAASGKRLCKYDEWKTACMGPAHTTFPYGDARQPGTCHDTGRSAVAAVFGEKALASPVPRASTARPAKKPPRGSARATQSRTSRSTKAPRVTSKGATKGPTKRPPPHGPAKKSARPASVEESVWAHLNDPALGRVEGALAKTGDHAQCTNSFGVFDMVGNIHEWVVTDPYGARGTFAGGYYLDTTINGDGCNYRTVAHAHEYHDYSTGFRCCADADPE